MNEVQEILTAAMGKNSEGLPNSSIVLNAFSFDRKTREEEEISTVASYSPEVQIKKLNGFVMVDLIFVNDFAPDLRRLWAAFELYGEQELSKANSSYHAFLIIAPLSYEGKVYIMADNPVFWTLQPQKPGDSINTVRILFRDCDLGIYKNDDIDIEAIKKSVDKEIELEEINLAQMIAKMEEEKEREIMMNEKYEEIRRNHDN